MEPYTSLVLRSQICIACAESQWHTGFQNTGYIHICNDLHLEHLALLCHSIISFKQKHTRCYTFPSETLSEWIESNQLLFNQLMTISLLKPNFFSTLFVRINTYHLTFTQQIDSLLRHLLKMSLMQHIMTHLYTTVYGGVGMRPSSKPSLCLSAINPFSSSSCQRSRICQTICLPTPHA